MCIDDLRYKSDQLAKEITAEDIEEIIRVYNNAILDWHQKWKKRD